MAKSKQQFKVRRVKSKEDRKRPSIFMRLRTDESFKGIALFEPDPEVKDNPGYLEYYDHYDKQANQYVPCAGDKCPFCAANDNPSTRALTVWYFPEASDKKDQIKVFTMNFGTINDIADEAEEEDGILGKTIRIKRLSDKGDYKVRVLSGKPLSKTELKKVQKLLEEQFQDGLEGLVEKQLVAQMERLKALEAMESDDDDDDDDDEEEETPKSRNSKSKSKVKEEEDEDEDDDDDEDEDEEEEEEDEDEDEDSDDDEDEDEDEEEESDDDEEDEAEAESISGGVYEIVKVNEKDEILDLKNDDGKVKMWVGDGVDVDYDEAKAKTSVKVDASQDEEGDWIITKLAIQKAKGGKGKGKKK